MPSLNCKTCANDIQFLATTRRDLHDDREEILSANTNLELDVHEAEVALSDAKGTEAKTKKEIDDLSVGPTPGNLTDIAESHCRQREAAAKNHSSLRAGKLLCVS